MARKKLIFVIVEGPSDDNAIGYFLDKIFDKNKVYVHIMHCDITTERGATPNNIHLKCCDIARSFANNNGYTKENFERIIHIVDTDGAFISSNLIIESSDVNHTIYSPQNIVCKSKSSIEARNKKKSDIINKLISCSYIWSSIPYNVYYMSCNLDHVLYNKQNSTDEEKERDSYAFQKEFEKNVNGFIDYISKSSFSVSGSYKETWEFIKKDAHSLNRYTNLSLCFPTAE